MTTQSSINKRQRHNTYIALQAATAAAVALYITDFGGHAAYRQWAKPAINHTHSPGLPFDGLHLRNPCTYMDYYSFTDPEGMEG